MSQGKAAAVLDPIEDEVFDLIASGVTQQEIASRHGLHFNSILNWVNAGGEARQAKHKAAKKACALWCVEEAGRLLEEAKEDIMPGAAAILKERVKRLLWLAEKYDRETYGDQPTQINVGLDFGSLHLDSLRQLGTMHKPAALPSPVEEAEYEVLGEAGEGLGSGGTIGG